MVLAPSERPQTDRHYIGVRSGIKFYTSRSIEIKIYIDVTVFGLNSTLFQRTDPRFALETETKLISFSDTIVRNRFFFRFDCDFIFQEISSETDND